MSNIAFHPFNNLSGGIDNSSSRFQLDGNVAITGNYQTGGLLPDWINITDQSGLPVVASFTSTLPQIQISQVGVTSNVAIVVGTNIPANGQSVTFFNLTGNANATVLNGLTLVVSNSNANSSSFNVPITTGNFPNVSVSGVGALVRGPEQFYAESVSGSGLTYAYNKANATIQIFNSNVELANGSNLAISDIVQGSAEFVRN